MNLREIHPTDAAAFNKLLSQLETESPHMLLEAGERDTTEKEQMEEIQHMLASDNQTIFIFEDGAELVGWCGAFGEKYRRTRHTILLAVGILEAYRKRGLGTRLFETMEAWAKKRGIRRMELLVQTNNKAGIALYRKMGFQIEGTKRGSYQIDGKYLDEYLMAKMLVKPKVQKRSRYPKW